jgi:hypothetical protein
VLGGEFRTIITNHYDKNHTDTITCPVKKFITEPTLSLATNEPGMRTETMSTPLFHAYKRVETLIKENNLGFNNMRIEHLVASIIDGTVGAGKAIFR